MLNYTESTQNISLNVRIFRFVLFECFFPHLKLTVVKVLQLPRRNWERCQFQKQ